MPTNCGKITDRRDQILVGIFKERIVDAEIVLSVSATSFFLLFKTVLSNSALIFSIEFNKLLSMKGPFFKDLIFFYVDASEAGLSAAQESLTPI